MKTQVLILAAGASRRFEGVKQIALLNKIPLINKVLSNFYNVNSLIFGVQSLTVCLGANAALVANLLPKRVRVLYVRNWQQGMGDTIAFAMGHLEPDTTHVLIGLADQVAITADQFESLLSASKQAPDKIVTAFYAGRAAVPAIFPRAYFDSLAEMSGDRGAQRLLQSNKDNLVLLDMPEAAWDIDTQEDLRAWQRSEAGK